MRKKWSSYLVNPLVVGFSLSFIIIFIFTRYLPRYYTELVEKTTINNNGKIAYSDINCDGFSEKLNYYSYDRIFNPTLYVYDSEEKFIDLWNFVEPPVQTSEIYTGDYNEDSLKEVFVFTASKDSIFLNIVSTSKENKLSGSCKFISKLKDQDSITGILSVGLFDLNEYEGKEFLFIINTDGSQLAGRCFLYDIANDQLKEAPKLNVELIQPICVNDINDDNFYEIILSNRSVDDENGAENAQFVILNHKLEFLFQPTVFYGGSSRVECTIVSDGSQKNIIVLNSGTTASNVFNSLKRFDVKGVQKDEVDIHMNDNLSLISLGVSENIWLTNHKKIYKYSTELKKKKGFKINKGIQYHLMQVDNITGDQAKEAVFKNHHNLLILSDQLRNKTKLNISGEGECHITPVYKKNNTNQISIQIGKNWYLFDFYKNEAFFYSSIFYLLIFIIVTFLVFILFRLRLRFLRIKEKVFKINDDELIDDIENNIEEKFSGIKTKIDQISDEFQDDSIQQLIHEIDETYKKVKAFSNKVPDRGIDIRESLENLVKNYQDILNLKYYLFAENDFLEIDTKIKDLVIRFFSSCIDFLSSSSKGNGIVLQIFQHDINLSLLIEIENVFLNHIDLNENVIEDIENFNANFEIDSYSDFGSIVSLTIPLFGSKPVVDKNNSKIKVIIAEDHDVSLFGLVSLLKTKDDIELVGTAKNGMEVLKILESKKTDIVITDISMPGMDGIELSERLKNEYPDIKVIVFTMYMENWFIEQLTKNGAKGFVSKNSKTNELIDAVRNVYEGSNYYCPQFKSKFGFNGNGNGASKKLDSLTKNELKIVELYAENMNRQQISNKMNLNIHTIDIFIANILLKLNAGDEEEVIRIAKKQKFVSE